LFARRAYHIMPPFARPVWEDLMQSQIQPISDRDFSAYAHPLLGRRFALALVFSILLIPVMLLVVIYLTIILIAPFIGLVIWISARVFFARMLGNSVVVSEVNYPRIHALAEELKLKLRYHKPVHIFVYEQGSFNAYMRFLFFRRAIFLNSELLQTGVSDNEVRWIVGRFIGYLRAREQASVAGWLIRTAEHFLMFNLFLFPYERAMVYTGDRLALAAMDGDIASAVSAMQKLLVGRQLGYSVNPEGIIDQQRQIKGTFFGFLARLPTHFPHMTARYVDLIVFAKAFFPAQFANFESANPGLPADLVYLATGAPGIAPMRPAPGAMTRPVPPPLRMQPTAPVRMQPSPSAVPPRPAPPPLPPRSQPSAPPIAPPPLPVRPQSAPPPREAQPISPSTWFESPAAPPPAAAPSSLQPPPLPRRPAVSVPPPLPRGQQGPG